MVHCAPFVASVILFAACAFGLDGIASARAGDSPDAEKRAALAAEKDVAALAAKIQALGVVDDPRTADVLLDVIARPSEVVRATATVALLKMTRPECLERLTAHGLAHADGVVRAHSARICGRLKLAAAGPALRAMIADDKYWLARAEAALACGDFADVDAKAALAKLLASDASEKARFAAMDALGRLGPSAVDAVPAIAANLTSKKRALRVGACRALGRLRSMDAAEPLIAQMFKEHGCVMGEIDEALKAITGKYLGTVPEAWWTWWWDRKETVRRPPTPYWQSYREYWFGYVIDASASMEQAFEPDAHTAEYLPSSASGKTKLAICRDVIARVLTNIGQFSKFQIVALAPTRSFSETLVEASAGDIAAATKWIRASEGADKADLFGGLRAILSLDASPDESPDFVDTVEVVTCMTDDVSMDGGMPPDALVEWYSARNRYAQIETSVVVYGTRGGDLDQLRALAERNWGRFILRKERER